MRQSNGIGSISAEPAIRSGTKPSPYRLKGSERVDAIDAVALKRIVSDLVSWSANFYNVRREDERIMLQRKGS